MSSSRSNAANNDANLEFVNQIVANSNQSDVDAAVAAITSAAKHGQTAEFATAIAKSSSKSHKGNDSAGSNSQNPSVEDVAAIAAAAQAVGDSESRIEHRHEKKTAAAHPKILPRIKQNSSSSEFSEAAKFKTDEDALKDSQIEKIIESVASSAAAAAANPANSHYMKKKQDSDTQSSFTSADKLAADLNSIASKKDQFKSEPKSKASVADSSVPAVVSDKPEISTVTAESGISGSMDKGTFATHSCSRCKRAFDLPIDGKLFKLCPHCRELQRQRSKRWQQKTREKDGVCRRCGKLIPDDESKFVLCSKCRTTLRDKKANRAELGKCVHCSGPNDPNSQFKVCQRCRNNDKSRRTRLEKDGLCNRCAKPLSPQDKGNYKVCSNCRTRKKRSVDEPTVVVLANNDLKIAIDHDHDSNIINNIADNEKASRKKQKTASSNGSMQTKNDNVSMTSNANSSDNEFIVAERIVQQLQSAAEQAAQVAAQAAKQQEEILHAGKTAAQPAANSSQRVADSKVTDGVAASDDANNLFMQPEAAESIKSETSTPASSKNLTDTTSATNIVDAKEASK